MKTKLMAFAALIAGITVTAMGDEPGRRWHRSFAAAVRDADAAGLPLLLHFHADWCGPCQRMERGVLNTPEVLQQLGTVVVGAKIDVDDEPEVARRFGVSSYPSDVLVAPDGDVLLRTGGYAGAGQYVERIRVAAAACAPHATVAESRSGSPSEAAPGLNGYSPVSIISDRRWREGRPELAWEHEQVVYHFVDAGELELFRADPARFAPQFSGRDPIALIVENRVKAGSIHYAAFYRHRLYLFSSSGNRSRFIESPDQYDDPHEAQFVSRTAGPRGSHEDANLARRDCPSAEEH